LNYGRTPSGYAQIVPTESQLAPILPAGAVYSFFAETTNAPIASGYFYMDTKGPIQTYIPDLCLTLKNGRHVRVRCSFTGDPTLREPTSLEEVIRKHRVRDTAEAERFTELEPCEPTADKPK
jgi:hypothetical protein